MKERTKTIFYQTKARVYLAKTLSRISRITEYLKQRGIFGYRKYLFVLSQGAARKTTIADHKERYLDNKGLTLFIQPKTNELSPLFLITGNYSALISASFYPKYSSWEKKSNYCNRAHSGPVFTSLLAVRARLRYVYGELHQQIMFIIRIRCLMHTNWSWTYWKLAHLPGWCTGWLKWISKSLSGFITLWELVFVPVGP